VTEVVAYSLPQIAEKYRLRISVFALNFRSTEWHSVVCAGFKGFVIEIDPVAGEARNRGELKGQFIRQLTPIASGLAFASTRIVTTVVNVEDDSRVIRSDDRGLLSMVRCGAGYLTREVVGDRHVIVRRDISGGFVRTLTSGPMDTNPSCSSDGSTWYYASAGPPPGIVRCDAHGCEKIVDGPVYGLVASPDGNQLATVEPGGHGLAVSVIDVRTRGRRRLIDTETICAPIWSSNETLWISRERKNAFVWTEIEVSSGRETGRTAPGTTNCSDGDEDPASPKTTGVRLLGTRMSQVRLLPWQYLHHP
jgi:hypothetical protein